MKCPGPLSYIQQVFTHWHCSITTKIAKVYPIFKSGDNIVFSNNRPISILPSISKILEKIMYTRLLDFVIKNDFFFFFFFVLINLVYGLTGQLT